MTRVAVSDDGLTFVARPEILGPAYFRVFDNDEYSYALSMPDHLSRSKDGVSAFEEGCRLGIPAARHTAVMRVGSQLFVFWTEIGDMPERIFVGHVDLDADWTQWRIAGRQEVLRPELNYEGADCPIEPSVPGSAYGRLNQLRDPYLFQTEGRWYLFYATAGESGIAVVEIIPV